jgi:hypothetical protein
MQCAAISGRAFTSVCLYLVSGIDRLRRFLHKDSREILLVVHRENRPQDNHYTRQWKSFRRHQCVEEKDVHDHWSKQYQGEDYESIHQKQNAANYLNSENDHPVVGREDRASKLGRQCTLGRWHWNKVKEAVQSEYKKDKP